MGVFGSNFGHAVTQNLPGAGGSVPQSTNQYLSAFTLASGPPIFTFPAVPSNGQLPLAGPNCFLKDTSPLYSTHIQTHYPSACPTLTRGTRPFSANSPLR